MRKFLFSTVAALALTVSAVNVSATELTNQSNNAFSNGSVNVAPTVAGGGQANAFVRNAEQDVEGVGGVASVDQKNDHGRHQTNTAGNNGAINFSTTLAAGVQGNAFVRNADQGVLGVGAQSTVAQENNKATGNQFNAANGNGAVNLGRTVALGGQLNLGVRNADQSVNATGAVSLVRQTNRRGSNPGTQVNSATGNVAVNAAPTFAAGAQVNVGVRNASQTVGAVGASSSVTQVNRD